MKLDIIILDVCKKELDKFPNGVLEDFLDAVALLERGHLLSNLCF